MTHYLNKLGHLKTHGSHRICGAEARAMKQKSGIITLGINYVDGVSDVNPPLVSFADDQA